MAATIAGAGGCDVLVNNAGRCQQSDVLRQPSSAQRAEFELNYWGPGAAHRALLPHFIERGRGWIVNVSSCSAACPHRPQ